MKKIALIVLDWFGLNFKTPEENAILQASPTPTIDFLFSQPYGQIKASGRAVGLPDGQMGNSEVGHMTLGTWRILLQPMVAIDELFATKQFEKLTAFTDGIEHVRTHHSKLHLIGLFWPGGIHSTLHHLEELIKIIPSDIPTFLHLFTDGRDLAPDSAYALMEAFSAFLSDFPHVKIASLGGRYFGMDRDNNRDRVQQAYDEIVFQQTQTSDTPAEYLKKQYELGKFDEFIPPVSFVEGEGIDDGDAVFHFNYRTDRARQFTQALEVSRDETKAALFEKRDGSLMIKPLHNVYLATMAQYFSEYDWPTFLAPRNVQNTLSEVLSLNELRQFHLAETEKFAHVTKFFNAEKETLYDGQENLLIPSHKVATFDLDPEMSAQEIMDALRERIQHFDFFVVNFANGDMVGHTWNMEACKRMVVKLDDILRQLLELSKAFDVDLLITADHGNCEEMGTPEAPKTAHTTNLVPFWWVKKWEVQAEIKKEGELSDFAPTVLCMFGIKTPEEMTGQRLTLSD